MLLNGLEITSRHTDGIGVQPKPLMTVIQTIEMYQSTKYTFSVFLEVLSESNESLAAFDLALLDIP